MRDPLVPVQGRFVNKDVETWRRKGLPHWQCPGGVYSLTLHCDGSLPRSVLDRIAEKRNRALREMEGGGRLERDVVNDIDDRYMVEVDQELDRGLGTCPLKDAKTADMVEETLRFFDRERYLLLSWSVMPNHLHSVFRLFEDQQLDKLVHSWKSFTTNRAIAIGSVSRVLWQEGYFDRWVRNTTDLGKTIQYVVDNPRKAGLENWRWSGRNDHAIREVLGL